MRITGRNPFCSYRRCLFIFLFVLLFGSPAYSIEFITEEDYLADKSDYRDYPIKILFKKLAEESGPEKSRITNYIILKQVFDKNSRAKAEAGGLKYEKSFGIIKEINERNVRLWLPETGSFKNYYTGIEKFPIEKTGKYEITASNIESCASVIYTLDQRIYKIKIEFRLSAPESLRVKREKNDNIISWKEISTEKPPDEYKVLVNGQVYTTVTGTSARLPRKKGKVDSYSVKAVYRRGNISLESNASEAIKDLITAKELQNERLAGETYDRVVALLNPGDYEKVRKLLYDSETFLREYLDPERRENTETLITVFRDIDEGDRLSTEKPETARNMGRALRFYERAEQNGNNLPPEMDVKFITDLKIKASLDRKSLLETGNKEIQALETLDRVITLLKPLEWEGGERLLYENRPFLEEFFDQDRREMMNRLVDFFQDIDQGDSRRSQGPETEENLAAALVFYERAGEKAEALSNRVDVKFIAQQRLREGLDRKNLLAIENKKLIAQERYREIISSLKPGEWMNSRMLLIDNRQFITEYLDHNRKENVERLVQFFQILEEGDQLSVIQPETEESLENALTTYTKAEQVGKEFDEGVDLTFITGQRIHSCMSRKTLLVARQREMEAAKKTKSSLKEPSKKPMVEIIGDQKIPDEDFDRDTTILLALKEFDEKKYQSSWGHFQKVLHKQILNIQKGGKNRVKGVLGLPVECRAEVFFLMEIDMLMNREDGSGISDEDLEKIGDRVDNRTGLWVMIRDNIKRKKIKHHLSTFDPDSFQ